MASKLGQQFTVGTKLTNDVSDFKKKNKEASESVKVVQGSLEDLEQQQDSLNKKIKGVAVGTSEYNKLARELAGVNTRVKDAELQFEGLDMEGRASEMKSVVGGLGDMATGIAAVSGSLAGHDLEKFVKTIETIEKTTIGITGAMEAWASGQKLLNSWMARSTTTTNAYTISLKKNTDAKNQNDTATTKLIKSVKGYSKAISTATIKVVAIVGAIVGLGTLFQTLYEFFPQVGKAFDNMVNSLVSGMKWLYDQSVDITNGIITTWNQIAESGIGDKLGLPSVETIKTTWDDITDYVGDKWDSVASHDFTKAWLENIKSLGGNVSAIVDQLLKELDSAMKKLDKDKKVKTVKGKTSKTKNTTESIDSQILSSVTEESFNLSRMVDFRRLSKDDASKQFTKFLNDSLNKAIEGGASDETIDKLTNLLGSQDSSTSNNTDISGLRNITSDLSNSFMALTQAMSENDDTVISTIVTWANFTSTLGDSLSNIGDSLSDLGSNLGDSLSEIGQYGGLIGSVVGLIGGIVGSIIDGTQKEVRSVANQYKATTVDNDQYFNRSGEYLDSANKSSNGGNVPVMEMIVRGSDLYRVLKRDDVRRGI